MSERNTWIIYLLLLILSVPWYFPAGSGEPIVAGFPLWCMVSLCCYVAIAALTVWRINDLWSVQAPADETEER